ncbi:MAG: hypothetical protein Q4D06_05420, partial [Coriobacteriia bacterium]|nr:hypothetical protein [Coriobacteriia bacterium]
MTSQILQFASMALPLVLLGLGIAFAAVAYSQSRKGESPLVQTGLATISFALSLLCFGVFVPTAEAAPADQAKQAPVDAPAIDIQVEPADGFQIPLGNDLVWAGTARTFSDVDQPNDLLLAGQTVRVQNSRVKGSIRAAAQNVTVSNTKVTQSVTLAGQTVGCTGGSSEAVALAGQTAAFTGTTKTLYAAAGHVTINGTVRGDAKVSAETLETGPDAVIDGTLTAELGKDPVIAKGAKVGEQDVTLNQSMKNADAELGEAAGALSAAAFGGMMIAKLLGVLGFLLVALLAEWLTRRQVADSAAMAKGRTGAMVLTGVIAALVAPLVLLILMCTVVGAPLAFGLTGGLLAIQMVGGGFAAASLAKLAFPKMGRYVGSLLMALIFGLVSLIPVVGWILSVAAFMYLLGYVLQKVFLAMTADRKPAQPQQPAEQPVQPAAPAVEPAAAVAAPVTPVA